MEAFNKEQLKKEVNNGLTKVFGRNKFLESNFIVRDIEIIKEKVFLQITPINYYGELNKYDDIHLLFVLYNVETKIAAAVSKSDFYNKHAAKLKLEIEKAFKITELKKVFRL
jgi:hypothetical protein